MDETIISEVEGESADMVVECFLSPQGISEVEGESAAMVGDCFLSPQGISEVEGESAAMVGDCFLSPQGISEVEGESVAMAAAANHWQPTLLQRLPNARERAGHVAFSSGISEMLWEFQ
eukprot:scaffold8483_cov76-Skeletonema_menzelii.AAC.1